MLVGGILHRRWTGGATDENGGVGDVVQVVVPSEYREALMQLAHEGRLAGHLGVRKTVQRLRRSFWWSGIAGQVSSYIRRCHTYQVVGKPNQIIPVVPLKPIPAVEPPFSRVMIDVVGPLPPLSAGNKYLLTIMDVTTRYPEAIPVRSIHAKAIVKHLIKTL